MALASIQQPPIRVKLLLENLPQTPLTREWEDWFRQVFLHLQDLEERVVALEPP